MASNWTSFSAWQHDVATNCGLWLVAMPRKRDVTTELMVKPNQGICSLDDLPDRDKQEKHLNHHGRKLIIVAQVITRKGRNENKLNLCCNYWNLMK